MLLGPTITWHMDWRPKTNNKILKTNKTEMWLITTIKAKIKKKWNKKKLIKRGRTNKRF